MKNKKLLILFVAIAMLVISVGVTASAYLGKNDVFYEETVSGIKDNSVFISGENVNSMASVNGMLLAAGNTVTMDGDCEYIMGAGRDVILNGISKKDAMLAGYSITIDGKVNRDVFAAAKTVKITGEVGRSLYACAETIVIEGEVDGDLHLAASKITVSDNAVIKGKMYYNSDSETIIPSNVFENAVAFDNSTVDEDSDLASNNVFDDIFGNVINYVGFVAIAFILLLFTPLWEKLDHEYYGVSFREYAKTFGIGFGVLAGVPLAFILLMLTIIGMRLAVVLLMIYVAVIIVAPIFFAFFIGMIIWRKLFKKTPCYWAELPVGLLIVGTAAAIPVLSFVVGIISIPLGLGVIILLLGKSREVSNVSDIKIIEENKEN